MYKTMIEGQLRSPGRSGERVVCEGCQMPLTGRVGSQVAPHWAHLDSGPCAWSLSLWHATWQACVPVENREVVRNGRRADVLTPGGVVVEFQHSQISAVEVDERERAHGVGLWVVDRTESEYMPAWTRAASWPVLADYGDYLMNGRRKIERERFIRWLNSNNTLRPQVTLDWGNALHWSKVTLPCQYCGIPQRMLDDSRLPACKVCAEANMRFTEAGL